MCTSELSGAPQCVVAACLKTVLNGWCTARRFKESQIRCRFGCGNKQDCIEHYLDCTSIEQIFKQLFYTEWGSFEHRLALGCAAVEGRVVRTYFLYAILSAYNFLRHQQLYAGDSCAEMIRSRIIFALGGSPSRLRNYFKAPHLNRMGVQGTPSRMPESVGEVLFTVKKRKWLDDGKRKRARVADGRKLVAMKEARTDYADVA